VDLRLRPQVEVLLPNPSLQECLVAAWAVRLTAEMSLAWVETIRARVGAEKNIRNAMGWILK
jgi:hypothetical protein